uniref:Uncharacterized protein n=1 Tax=Anguilla anguilla TaxID=7936 RepID=A0A0E9TF06_ANGAN
MLMVELIYLFIYCCILKALI